MPGIKLVRRIKLSAWQIGGIVKFSSSSLTYFCSWLVGRAFIFYFIDLCDGLVDVEIVELILRLILLPDILLKESKILCCLQLLKFAAE